MKLESLRKQVKQMPIWMWAFLINFIAGMAAICPLLIRDGGYLGMPFDYTAQELAFNMFMNDSIKDGNILWNWAIDLGGNFLESFSFYNVGSIFFWITLLFPAESFPRVIGWIIILKFAVAGATSAAYFHRHIKNKTCVILASLLYAFSGFQCSSVIFYHFQDSVAFFPLLLIGLEKLVEEKKRGRLALACLINILCNYVFFVGQVIFLVIYYVVRYLIPEILEKKQFKKVVAPIGSCMAEGALGLVMAGVLLVPSIHGTLSNSRVSNHLPGYSWFSMSTTDWLLMLKALLLPAEAMGEQSSVLEVHWMTNAAYLPLFGICFVVAYLLTKKDWISRLLKVCFVIAIIPIVNNMFMFFSSEIYRRWYYMAILIMALATAKVLEKPEKYKVKAGVSIAVLLLGFFYIMTSLVPWNKSGDNLVFHRKDYYIGLMIAVGGIVLIILSMKLMRQRYRQILCAMTVVFSSVTLCHSILCYQDTIDNTNQEFGNYVNGYGKSAAVYLTEIAGKLDEDVLPYRYYIDEAIGHTYYNMTLSHSLPSINSFISTVHPSVTEFYDAIGMERILFTDGDDRGTRELLGAKYLVSVTEREDWDEQYKYIDKIENSNGQVFYLYENEGALPIGYTYDTYMTKSEYNTFEWSWRPQVMLNTLVIEEADVEKASQHLEHFDGDDYAKMFKSEREDFVKARRKETSEVFEADGNTFRSVITADSNKYAFFTVPYDKYWKATVNGQAVEVLNVNSLMAVPVWEGTNDIRFEYDYLPLKAGVVCSVAGVLILMVYLFKEKRVHKKRVTIENIEGNGERMITEEEQYGQFQNRSQ